MNRSTTHLARITPQLAPVSDRVPVSVVRPRTEVEARERIVLLAHLGFQGCSVSQLARAWGCARSTPHRYGTYDGAGALAVLDLLIAPTSWSLPFVRGLHDAIEPRTCGTLSQAQFVVCLSRVACLIAQASDEDPAKLTDEQLERRRDEFDATQKDLSAARRKYDDEAVRRVQEAAEKGHKR